MIRPKIQHNLTKPHFHWQYSFKLHQDSDSEPACGPLRVRGTGSDPGPLRLPGSSGSAPQPGTQVEGRKGCSSNFTDQVLLARIRVGYSGVVKNSQKCWLIRRGQNWAWSKPGRPKDARAV
eukprot:758194-Rhodomonas_salina.3